MNGQTDRQMDSYSYINKLPWGAQFANASGVAVLILSPDKDKKYSSACLFFR